MSGLNSPWFLQQFRDVNGSPLAGGKLYFYVAGSTTLPKAVYTDFPMVTPYSQPVILDGSGFAPEYFMASGLYKVVVRSSDDRLIATRDNVAGSGGSTTPAPTDPFSAAISSFSETQINWITDPTGDIFGDDGCFCWIIPARNILTVNWFKTVSSRSIGFALGRVSIWGANDFDFADGVKLSEFSLPDYTGNDIFPLGVDTSTYKWIGVACDPGRMDQGVPIMQTGLVLPFSGSALAPRFFGYVGQHDHNTAFATFPPIYAEDPKYMMTRWMQLGCTFQGAES